MKSEGTKKLEKYLLANAKFCRDIVDYLKTVRNLEVAETSGYETVDLGIKDFFRIIFIMGSLGKGLCHIMKRDDAIDTETLVQDFEILEREIQKVLRHVRRQKSLSESLNWEREK